MNPLLDAALEYREAGLSVFPCKMVTPEEVESVRQKEGAEAAEKFIKANSKHPKFSWKPFQESIATEAEIKGWFAGCDPERTAIAIVTGRVSGITVVDIDNTDLIPEIKKHDLGSPLAVKTGRGVHLYYSYNPQVKTCKDFRRIKGLDIRNDGGYVLAPPSPHHLGKSYHFLKGDFASHQLSEPPSWLWETGQKCQEFFPVAAHSINLEHLKSALSAIPADDYDTWYKVGMSLKNALGSDGLAIWREWSETSEKFNPDEIDSKWESFGEGHPSPVTAGTIYHLAKENGWVESSVWVQPKPLPEGLHPVKSFDYDLLPETLQPWVKDICERMQAPPDFVAVGLMVGLGSLMVEKLPLGPRKIPTGQKSLISGDLLLGGRVS